MAQPSAKACLLVSTYAPSLTMSAHVDRVADRLRGLPSGAGKRDSVGK